MMILKTQTTKTTKMTVSPLQLCTLTACCCMLGLLLDLLYADKGRPCLVIDGRSQDGFRRWRKATMHPTKLTKKMSASELLVSV